MKILVTGVKGQLGYDVCKVLNSRGIENWGIDRGELDITDAVAVRECLMQYRPDAVIHCAAYTAVDKAEDCAEQCAAVNVAGTRNLAQQCKDLNCKMMYISTDYIFPGTGERFYEVDDATGPLGVYGKTKLEGELAIKKILQQYFIVRVSWVFGKNGNNFVKTMLRLGKDRNVLNVVCDQIGSPTYTADLALLLCDMIVTEKYGTYHATNEGVCSWAEFAQEIFRQAKMDVRVNPIPTKDYPSVAERPLNSRMSKKSLDEAEFARLPDWRMALKKYLEELGE